MNPDEIRHLFEAQHMAVRVVTYEESEVCDGVLGVAAELHLAAYIWDAVSGLRRADVVGEVVADTTNAGAALRHLALNLVEPSLCIFLDLAGHLDDKLILRALRDFLERLRDWNIGGAKTHDARYGSRLCMIDHLDGIPSVVAALSTRYDIAMPDDAEIEAIVRKTLRRLNAERPIRVDSLTKADNAALISNLRGLSRRQIAQAVAELVVEDHELSREDLPRLVAAKRKLLQTTGVLEAVDAPMSLSDIGGLSRLKAWLASRTRSFEPGAVEFGITPPRGVLLLGVQGAGKSLAAKAIATAWTRPLMRLDPGALYDKFVGESESRLRDALRQAEAMSPVVLWIDEIEKGFAGAAGQSTDGGLSRRMFGTLLTWMQERKQPVFLVATANDIEALPPELLRKGRFDEIFFVDLPGESAREAIFAIHLRKRRQKPESFDLKALAAAAAGFSGAEIEQAVLAGLHEAYTGRDKLDTQRLISIIQGSPPLSVTMREKMQDLREWAVGRCVPAD